MNLASRYLECQSSTSLFGDKEDPVAGLVEVTNLGAEISGGVPRGVAANGGAMAAIKDGNVKRFLATDKLSLMSLEKYLTKMGFSK